MEKNKKVLKWIKQLKKSAHRGSAQALVSEYYDEILGYVYKRADSKEVALDITQEIFVSALGAIANFDTQLCTFKTWLYVIVNRRIADYYRSADFRHKQQTVSDEPLQHLADIEFKADESLEIREICDFLDELEPDRREIFKLKVFEDFTFSKIAEITGMPESSVKTSFYATQRLVTKKFRTEVDFQ